MSDKGALDETSVAIGRLLGGIETLTRAMSEDRLAAAQYRTDMRREMKEQSGMLHEVVGELKSFKREMEDMRTDVEATKKDVAEHRDARLRAQGALGLGKSLWSVVLGVTALVSGAVTALFHLLSLKPPPH
jgi:hypothetical protein